MTDSYYLPKVGDKLYLYRETYDYYCNEVKTPATVIRVEGKYVYVRECDLIFDPEDHYFDSMPIDIREGSETNREYKLMWKAKWNCWGERGQYYDYPKRAVFGEWKYAPYLN